MVNYHLACNNFGMLDYNVVIIFVINLRFWHANFVLFIL